ncbi:outer membrane protein [Bacteroidia bacterium]|nr:outer membrane protein [Bacteroidia bacterium]
MKRLFFVLGLAVALFACNDETTNTGEIPADDPGTPTDTIPAPVPNLVNSDADALALAQAGFTSWKSISASVAFVYEVATDGANSFEGGESAGGPLISKFTITPTNSYTVKLYNAFYSAITNANKAIDAIEPVPAAAKVSGDIVLTTAAKDKAIANAKFIRALSYWYLVRSYGKVPLFLHAEDAKDAPRAAIDDIYTQIVNDLEEAVPGLPLTSNFKSQPSKYSAKGLLSSVYLSWAYAKEAVNSNYLEKVVEFATEVIESGDFSLIEDVSRNVGRYNKNGPELLFVFNHEFGATGRDGGNHQSHCSFTFAFDYSEEYHMGLSDMELYNRWDDKDQRKEYNYPSQLFNADDRTLWTFLPPQTYPPFGKGIDRSYERGPNDSPYERDFDRVELRLAEIILNKAEALIDLNRVPEGIQTLNLIRRRAYFYQPDPAAFDLSSSLTKDQATDALRLEREHEFIYESKHWFDLTRWRTLIQTVKSVENWAAYKQYTDLNAAGIPNIIKHNLQHLHEKVKNVGIQHYLFPLPKTALDGNPNLTQNYGYDSYNHPVEAKFNESIYK